MRGTCKHIPDDENLITHRDGYLHACASIAEHFSDFEARLPECIHKCVDIHMQTGSF